MKKDIYSGVIVYYLLYIHNNVESNDDQGQTKSIKIYLIFC